MEVKIIHLFFLNRAFYSKITMSRAEGLCAASTPNEKVTAVTAATVTEIKRTRNGANGGEMMQIEDKKENM